MSKGGMEHAEKAKFFLYGRSVPDFNELRILCGQLEQRRLETVLA
jgi:hypothetical protein